MKRLLRSAINKLGYDIRRIHVGDSKWAANQPTHIPNVDKIHYGCGPNLFTGWLNVDLWSAEKLTIPQGASYLSIDLTGRHPFGDGVFSFGYCEDFLECIDQDESIRFLIEARRTLKKGGVLRLSFPGLEGVLSRHYANPTLRYALLASEEAYSRWSNIHFYSRAEIELVARHVGFSEVRFERFGKSRHEPFSGIDQRMDQASLNTYVELEA